MAIKLTSLKTGKSKKPPLLVLYGTHGIGKTTFANDAKCVFLSVEDGLSQIDLTVGAVPFTDEKNPRTVPNTYDEAVDAVTALLDQDHSFKAFCVDTIDALQVLIFKKVCEDSKTTHIEKACGGYGKGYIEAQNHMLNFLHLLNRLRDEKSMAIIVLAHSRVIEFKNPDGEPYDRYTMNLHISKSGTVDMPGKVMEWADAVLFASYKAFTREDSKGNAKGIGKGTRIMRTEERPSHLAKNRFDLPYEIELTWKSFLKNIGKKGTK